MARVDSDFWRDRSVLFTGHTGFKGSWLTLWLQQLGARVSGLSRSVPGRPALYAEADAGRDVEHLHADLRDRDAVAQAVAAAEPEIVFHLAAQPLVRRALEAPVETFGVNVMGTAHLLAAAVITPGIRAVVVVSSHDVYAPSPEGWPRREGDPLRAEHPYAAAKVCVELVTRSMSRSLLEPAGVAVAAARSGNVLGGGDWGEGRLVPETLGAAMRGRVVSLREPRAVRPWQFVLDPLRGYLLLAEALYAGRPLPETLNFGPSPEASTTVGDLVGRLTQRWSGARGAKPDTPAATRPVGMELDSSRAERHLGWAPAWGLGETVDAVVEWYAAYAAGEDVRAVTLGQLEAYDRCVGGPSRTLPRL